jgi:hypothetical protein
MSYSTEPRLAELRAASKGMPPLDLADAEARTRLGRDGLWLWDTLGAVLLARGYLTHTDGIYFELLCSAYERRAERGFEQGFQDCLLTFAVTPQLVQQLEAARRA